jgi:pimeloyl-ACP methyl ester carboxylesterase
VNPFYFGSDDRRLFGLYTPARGRAQKTRAVLLCHAWGPEYLQSHRSMRHLAGLLAGSGFDVLTFDYFGTGDSAGDLADADLQGWSSDIEEALRELKDVSGASRVSVIGLRLGATLAAAVCAKPRKDVEALALWDPIVSGARYVDYLHSASRPHRRRPAEFGGGIEVMGFPLTEAMEQAMRAVDLALLVPALPRRTLVVRSEPGVSGAELERAMQSHPDGPLSIRSIPAKATWLEEGDFGPGAVPVPLLKNIVEWLG